VTLLGRVGEDANGALVRRFLRRNGVDVSRLIVAGNRRTKVATICVRKDGTWFRRSAEPDFFHYVSHLNLQDEGGLRRFHHVHVAGVQGLLRVAPSATFEIIQRCRDNGLTLSFGLTDSRCDRALVRDAIATGDLVIGTAREFGRLLKRRVGTRRQLIEALRLSDLRNCVVTLGASGVLAKWQGSLLSRVPAPSVVPRNSIGAGDVFGAVLVAEVLKRRPISTALRLATSAASRSVAGRIWVRQLAVPEI